MARDVDAWGGAEGIEVYYFDEAEFDAKVVESIDEARSFLRAGRVVWINIVPHDIPAVLNDIGRRFGIPRAVLQDVAARRGRPRTKHDHFVHMSTLSPMLTDLRENPLDKDYWDVKEDDDPTAYLLRTEPLDIFVGDGWVITIQPTPRDVFGRVRVELANPAFPARQQRAGYLAAVLLDAVVAYSERYLRITEKQIERVMSLAGEGSAEEFTAKIAIVKEDLRELRLLALPHKTACAHLRKSPERSEQTKFLLESVESLVDHMQHRVQAQLERAMDAQDTHHSTLAVRTNLRIHRLTRIATILIPISVTIAWVTGWPNLLPLIPFARGDLRLMFWGGVALIWTVPLLATPSGRRLTRFPFFDRRSRRV